MTPKGGTGFFLLLMACITLAMPAAVKPANKVDHMDICKQLMMKCLDKGYPIPQMTDLTPIFNNSDVPADGRNSDQSNTLLSTFLDVLNLVPGVKDRNTRSLLFMDVTKQMTNKMWNSSQLSAVIKLMRNSSNPSMCYIQAFMAPMSWAALTGEGENNIDANEYDTLLWAAKPVLQDVRSSRMSLPGKVKAEHIKKMMNMLQDVYDLMSEDERTVVVDWAKDQITQNFFNCTMRRPPSDANSRSMDYCKPSVRWLDLDALTMMGPYISYLRPDDVDSSPKEKLCEFFKSAQWSKSTMRTTQMNPSLSKKFLNKIQECYSGERFPEHADKLGPLACYYYNPPNLTPDLSQKLLSQLEDCDNPLITKLKKRLVNIVMSNTSSAPDLWQLGSSVTLLTSKQLSEIPGTKLKEVLQNLRSDVQWKPSQLHALVKKQLSDKKCNEVPGEELMALQSVAEGLPSCVFKHVKAQDFLNDTEALVNISKRMRKGQLKAMLQGLRGDVNASQLVQKLSGRLLRSVSLDNLDKANITTLDQVENKTWSLPQAAFLATKLQKLKQLKYRRLHSVLQGITCKMIDNAADSDALDIALAMTETQEWLSKFQAECAAEKLFETLEKERSDFFINITKEELDMIPTLLLLRLSPWKVKDLPDSVCPVFLNKMEMANLSSLPLRSPSRPALTQRALLCLTNGTDLSGLTTADMFRLGPLLCELQPSQLRLLAPVVLNSSLQAMASCQHIPQQHREALIQLVNQTFGNSYDWSAETVESLGPLLLLDDNAVSALPNKPWMKDVLYFLKSRLPRASDALKKKLFNLTTSTSASTAARKKRQANTGTGAEPTQALIEELGVDNVYWTAAQLGAISNDTFLATVETLGAVPDFSAEQLDVLSQKAVEAFGPVSQMTESVVLQLGCITQAFPNSDLENLPFALDSLEEIARCGWRDSQLQPVWKGVAKYNNLTAQQLGAPEMVALNRFICGLNSNEISQLSTDAFKDAVGSLNGLHCSYQAIQQFKSLAVAAYGDPDTWTAAQVSDLGNFVAGLDAAELASLDSSVLPFLSQSSIPLIPPKSLAELSAAQLKALGPDNAAMVTSEQQAALTEDQRASLEKAATGSRDRSQPVPTNVESGAPSLSVEGISAYMKPLLFLFMGFLLL
ncbi:otoancorin [Mugil cephalus]|uniref:otoancorin n=1 Tax=Mugil cephalus TaxID=48193 RepID=UPI001FB8080A|nr:otoancorin [Mugil cephalus]